jgi:hypothetical protein
MLRRAEHTHAIMPGIASIIHMHTPYSFWHAPHAYERKSIQYSHITSATALPFIVQYSPTYKLNPVRRRMQPLHCTRTTNTDTCLQCGRAKPQCLLNACFQKLRRQPGQLDEWDLETIGRFVGILANQKGSIMATSVSWNNWLFEIWICVLCVLCVVD